MGSCKGKHYVLTILLICGMMIALITKIQSEFNKNINNFKHLVNKMADEEMRLKASQKELQNMLLSTERFKERLRMEEALTNEIEELKSSAQRKIIYRALLSTHRK